MSEKYTDKRLLKVSKQSGKYIKLEEGDSFKGTYLSWKLEKDEKFNKQKPVFLFKSKDGEEKQLGTSAKGLGKAMSHVIPGSYVQITRGEGTGPKTNYVVKVLKSASIPKDSDDEDEDEEDDEDEDVEEKDDKDEDEEDDDEDEEEELFD